MRKKERICAQRIRNERIIFSLSHSHPPLSFTAWGSGSGLKAGKSLRCPGEKHLAYKGYCDFLALWLIQRKGGEVEVKGNKGERGRESDRETETDRDKKEIKRQTETEVDKEGDRGRQIKRGEEEGRKCGWQMCFPQKFTPWCLTTAPTVLSMCLNSDSET